MFYPSVVECCFWVDYIIYKTKCILKPLKSIEGRVKDWKNSMKFVFRQQDMCDVLDTMLYPDEVNVCPVYCVFGSTSLFERCKIVRVGFVSCTNTGRLLIAKDMVNRWVKESYMLHAIKEVKIRENLFGQYVIRLKLQGGEKDIKYKLQISPKIVGGNFEYQEQNLKRLVEMLSRYAS